MEEVGSSEVGRGPPAFGFEEMFNLSLDVMCLSTVEGNFVRVNKAFEQTLGYTAEELCSRSPYDFLHPEDRERARQAMEGLARGEELHQFENRWLCRDGSIRWLQWNTRPVDGFVAAAGRDVTDSRARKEQAALRRVATLVARGVSSSEVFAAVAREMVNCLDSDGAGVFRYEADGSATVVATSNKPGSKYLPLGERMLLDRDNLLAWILQTGRTARHDDLERAAGPVVARVKAMGIRSGVGAPVVVDGRVWGAAVLASSQQELLPPDIEERLGDFAELLATAIANAATRDELIATRDELIASRARIVAAADDARRRLERNLHDGAQQRLVSLGLELRLAQSSVPPELQPLKQQLSGIVSGLTAVSAELQEISRGIHPAILSDGGLGPALRTLARRCPIPANVDVLIEGRLREPVEVAAYYVVAEALTNAAKYSRATNVNVCAEVKETKLCLSIQDDGIGGADSGKGSGLIGLNDRVEVLGGHMNVISPPGIGTTLHVTIPLNS